MARIDSFLRLVAEQRASDLHLAAGHVPTIRHDGELIGIPYRKVNGVESRRFIYEILTLEQQEELEEGGDLDMTYELTDGTRFRINVFQQSQGPSAVFRIIPNDVPSLESMRFPRSVEMLTDLHDGLVLVTGPTGSGKTTTLAALVHEINQTSDRHIITIEDPIEFVHDPRRSVITQREVHHHTDSFASALRAALRESPDVVVIGEMRDLETISLALSAAETGVLVFGTLHTNSAASAVKRIIDAVPAVTRNQTLVVLSVLLRGVIAQQLCRRFDGEGRVVAMEVMLQNHAVAHMIRENKVHQLEAYLQSVSYRETGMQSLDRSLVKLVKSGRISAETALKSARYPDTLVNLLERTADPS